MAGDWQIVCDRNHDDFAYGSQAVAKQGMSFGLHEYVVCFRIRRGRRTHVGEPETNGIKLHASYRTWLTAAISFCSYFDVSCE